MNNSLNRKLGVFGPRNSGKTTYWACLYGSKGSADGSVSFTHEPTREQLDALWRSLYDGVVAPATAQGEPQDIIFSLHSDATTWCVSTKDYSGSLVELSRHGQDDAEASHDLRRNIASWVRDCDAMLVLVPADLADQDEGARVGFRRAMEGLLDAFHASDHPGPLPVCLAVTKSDMLPADPAINSTPPAVESPPALPEWLDELATLVRHQVGEDHARVFLTSAFGGHAPEDATRPPETGPRPRGLEEPLRWVLAESDRCLSAPVIAKARRSLERRWFHGYGKAIKACDRVAAKGLPEKEGQELDELKARLVAGRQKERRRRVIMGALIAVLLTLAGFWLHADRLATNAKAAMSAESVAPDAIASVCAFVESTNPACFILHADEQKRAQDWYDARAQEQVVRVKDMLSRNADVPELHWRERVERAEARTKACRGFAELFPQRKERLEFDQEVSQAQALMEKLQAYGPFDDEYANVMQSLERASVSQARELVRSFTDSFPPEKYPLRTAAFQRLHSVVDSKAKGEEHARLVTWEAQIRADYDKDPSLRSRHLEEIEKWLAAYQASGIQELGPLESGLKDLRHGISEDWDRESYRKLETAAGRMFEGEDKLKEAIQYGDEYLQASRDVTAMKGYVRDWLLYARALQATRRVGLQCSYIKLWSTKFDESGKEQVKVVMKTRPNARAEWGTWSSPGMKEFNGESSLATSPDYVSLALQGAALRLEVTEYDWPDGNEEGSSERPFLKLLEQYQPVGSDKAEAQIDVDGAKVTVVISDLPIRRNLPSYDKPQ
jgi:hypothetical protein